MLVEGEEVDENDNVIGEAYPFEFAVGQEGYYESPGMDLEDFKVTEIIPLRMKKKRKTKL